VSANMRPESIKLGAWLCQDDVWVLWADRLPNDCVYGTTREGGGGYCRAHGNARAQSGRDSSWPYLSCYINSATTPRSRRTPCWCYQSRPTCRSELSGRFQDWRTRHAMSIVQRYRLDNRKRHRSYVPVVFFVGFRMQDIDYASTVTSSLLSHFTMGVG
jgi:hypothetical protein